MYFETEFQLWIDLNIKTHLRWKMISQKMVNKNYIGILKFSKFLIL